MLTLERTLERARALAFNLDHTSTSALEGALDAALNQVHDLSLGIRLFAHNSDGNFTKFLARTNIINLENTVWLALNMTRDLIYNLDHARTLGRARKLARARDTSCMSAMLQGNAVLWSSLCCFKPPNFKELPDALFPLGLLIAAARASVTDGKVGAEELKTGVIIAEERDVDLLWLAFARHIARLSTPEDRVLLEDLAAHPEKREGTLSWGLQYIVRGDVLLPDGTEVTLDELCADAGVPPYPLLEDMPPEIEMD